MAVQEIKDIALPNFVCSNPRVIVKFTADDCPVCVALAPTFLELSDQARYAGISFLKMDAKENPVASKHVGLTAGTPFMVTYCNGSLGTCTVVSSQSQMITLLDNLL